ncbi:MAG: hypothetical protein Q7W05_04180, partial [Deltaproteobacteria bacterium]|nr:hypothetical protein [Deltaproteobacteria bacterium]
MNISFPARLASEIVCPRGLLPYWSIPPRINHLAIFLLTAAFNRSFGLLLVFNLTGSTMIRRYRPGKIGSNRHIHRYLGSFLRLKCQLLFSLRQYRSILIHGQSDRTHCHVLSSSGL